MDEESINPEEQELLRQWSLQSPDAAQVIRLNPDLMAMRAREHLDVIQDKVDAVRSQSPEMPLQMVQQMFEDEKWRLPDLPRT